MNYTEFEQVPRLAEEIRAAVAEANLDYEALIAGLFDERLKTLREKYPDFAAANIRVDRFPKSCPL